MVEDEKLIGSTAILLKKKMMQRVLQKKVHNVLYFEGQIAYG